MTAVSTGTSPWAHPDPGTYPTLNGFVSFYGVQVTYIGDDGDVLCLGHPGELRALAAVRALFRRDCGRDEANRKLRWYTHPLATDVEFTWARLLQNCDNHPRCGEGCGECADIAAAVADGNWWISYSGVQESDPGAFPVAAFQV